MFTALTGSDLEGPLLKAVYDVWRGYSEATAREVGDKNTWLEWFEFECDMGERPKEVIFTNGQRVLVATLEDLAHVICS